MADANLMHFPNVARYCTWSFSKVASDISGTLQPDRLINDPVIVKTPTAVTAKATPVTQHTTIKGPAQPSAASNAAPPAAATASQQDQPEAAQAQPASSGPPKAGPQSLKAPLAQPYDPSLPAASRSESADAQDVSGASSKTSPSIIMKSFCPPPDLEIDCRGRMRYFPPIKELCLEIGDLSSSVSCRDPVPELGLKLNTLAHAFRLANEVSDMEVMALGHVFCLDVGQKKRTDIGMEREAWDKWRFRLAVCHL